MHETLAHASACEHESTLVVAFVDTVKVKRSTADFLHASFVL